MDLAMIKEMFISCRLFLVSTLCGLSLMIALFPLLTDTTLKYIDIQYGYDIFLQCVGVVCLMILPCVLKVPDSGVTPAFSKYYPSFIVIAGLGSLIFPGIDIDMINFLKSCSPTIDEKEGIVKAERVMVAIFSILLCALVPYLRNKKPANPLASAPLMFVIVAALNLCVRGLDNVIWANNIISADIGNTTTYVPPAISIFKDCLNASSWISNVERYKDWYRVGYMFQTELSLLSLIILTHVCVGTPIDDDNASVKEERGHLLKSHNEINHGTSIREEDPSCPVPKTKFTFKTCCKESAPSIMLFLGLVYLIILTVFDWVKLFNWKDPAKETLGYAIAELFSILVITVVTCLAYYFTKDLVTTRRRLNAREFVFLFSASGHLIFLLFKAVLVFDRQTDTNYVPFVFTTVFHFIELFVQITLVMKLARINDILADRRDDWSSYLSFRLLLLFVGSMNFVKWAGDITFTPPFIKHFNAHHSDLHLQITWKLITQVLYPFVALSRLLAAIACLETYGRLQVESKNYLKIFLIWMNKPW